MFSLKRHLGSGSERTLRYNAKTSMSTRYPDDFGESDPLLRSTTGPSSSSFNTTIALRRTTSKSGKKRAREEDPDYIDEPWTEELSSGPKSTRALKLVRSKSGKKPAREDDPDYIDELQTELYSSGPNSTRALKLVGSKPGKKRARKDDPDHIDEPETETRAMGDTIRTLYGMSLNQSSASDMQLLHELALACETSLVSNSEQNGSPSQKAFYITACSLECQPEMATASSPLLPITVTDPTGTSITLSPAVHWHLHSHSAGRKSQCRAHLNNGQYIQSPCFHMQHVKGVLARMKMQKPWPADRAVFEVFKRVNGGGHVLDVRE